LGDLVTVGDAVEALAAEEEAMSETAAGKLKKVSCCTDAFLEYSVNNVCIHSRNKVLAPKSKNDYVVHRKKEVLEPREDTRWRDSLPLKTRNPERLFIDPRQLLGKTSL
jgi:hypothetical protein